MPRGDRTGPNGAGPMTGRRAGFCAGNNLPGYANPNNFGYGGGGQFGYRGGGGGGRGGGGGGRGRRNMYYATGLTAWQRDAAAYQPPNRQPTEAEELEILKNEAASMEKALKEINKRMTKLEKDSE